MLNEKLVTFLEQNNPKNIQNTLMEISAYIEKKKINLTEYQRGWDNDGEEYRFNYFHIAMRCAHVDVVTLLIHHLKTKYSGIATNKLLDQQKSNNSRKIGLTQGEVKEIPSFSKFLYKILTEKVEGAESISKSPFESAWYNENPFALAIRDKQLTKIEICLNYLDLNHAIDLINYTELSLIPVNSKFSGIEKPDVISWLIVNKKYEELETILDVMEKKCPNSAKTLLETDRIVCVEKKDVSIGSGYGDYHIFSKKMKISECYFRFDVNFSSGNLFLNNSFYDERLNAIMLKYGFKNHLTMKNTSINGSHGLDRKLINLLKENNHNKIQRILPEIKIYIEKYNIDMTSDDSSATGYRPHVNYFTIAFQYSHDDVIPVLFDYFRNQILESSLFKSEQEEDKNIDLSEFKMVLTKMITNEAFEYGIKENKINSVSAVLSQFDLEKISHLLNKTKIGFFQEDSSIIWLMRNKKYEMLDAILSVVQTKLESIHPKSLTDLKQNIIPCHYYSKLKDEKLNIMMHKYGFKNHLDPNLQHDEKLIEIKEPQANLLSAHGLFTKKEQKAQAISPQADFFEEEKKSHGGIEFGL